MTELPGPEPEQPESPPGAPREPSPASARAEPLRSRLAAAARAVRATLKKLVARAVGLGPVPIAAGLGIAALVGFLGGLRWWHDSPVKPLEGLGFESSARRAAAEVLAEDVEQQAFLERRKQALAAERSAAQRDRRLLEEPGESASRGAAVTLTDRDLVHHLSGRWRLDLGRGSVIADFAPVVVDRVTRGALLVELFPVAARGLPNYFTPLRLPERGTFLAFADRDGEYRLVLEGLRRRGEDVLTYRISGSSRRLTARRISRPRESEEPRRGLPGGAPEEPAAVDRSARGPVEIRIDPPPPVEKMWRRARELREQGKFHSLETHLTRMSHMHPTHSPSRRWRRRVDGWIRDQERDLRRDVRKRLEDLGEALEDRDLGDIAGVWDDALPAETRSFFRNLLRRHDRLRVRSQLHSVAVHDGVADFRATLTLEASGEARQVDIMPFAWAGQLRDGHFISPFPG
ncbi:MAG: hypothetical protein AAF725_01070 [Acidobacteriota bacterium]